jgi:hypothetical protein
MNLKVCESRKSGGASEDKENIDDQPSWSDCIIKIDKISS